MEVVLPHTSFTVRRVYSQNSRDVDNEVLEGEAPMSQQQQDYYKAIKNDSTALNMVQFLQTKINQQSL